MSPEAQRIVIAKSVGWTGIYYNPVHGGWMGTRPKEDRDSYYLLDYLNDLNAMHEAEKILDITKVEQYCSTLVRIVRHSLGIDDYESILPTRFAVYSTAAQRAEAFLKTIGKWEGGSDES